MKKISTIFFIAFIFSLGTIVVLPNTASAQTASGQQQIGRFTAQANAFSSSTGNGPVADTSAGQDTGELAKVMTVIMSLFAWLLGVAMVILDNSVYYTVFTMGNYIHNLSAIGVAWRILRDMGNMVLIFGFLAIGITTIIDTDFYGSRQKMLPMLLIVAIFLNFSLFISEAIIDVGNLFASEIYSQINDGQTPTTVSFTETSFQNEGVSNKIMSQLGLQSLYGDALQTNVGENGNPSNNLFTGSDILIIGFMGCILFIITAFVMLSLAIILITRFVMLVFLIIVAPIGFAGLAVPKLQGTAKKWWNTLFQQTITAPILLLLLYVALAVITDANFVTGLGKNVSNTAWVGSLNGGDLVSFGSILLSFLVAMGLLLFVTRAAKEMSAFGAAAATKYAAWGSFGLTALGTSAVLNGVGRSGRFAVQNSSLKGTRTGRYATQYLFRPLENARGDVRNLNSVYGVPLPVGKALQSGLKAGGASDEARAPLAKSAGSRIVQLKDYVKKTNEDEKKQYNKETAIPPVKRIGTETTIALQDGDYSKVSGILSSVSDTDLESEAWVKELAKNPLAASLLPQAKFDKIQGSSNLSLEQKAEVAKARKEGSDPDNKDSRYNFDPTGFKYGPTLSNGAPHPHAGKTRGDVYLESLKTSKARGALTGDILLKKQAPGARFPYLPRNEVLSKLKAADFDSIRTKQKDELDYEQREALGEYIKNIISYTSVDPRKGDFAIVSANPQFKNYYTL